ncbi:MAG: DUF2997 domain-containing protein [Planctomycetaceae bacterium]|nr:DUF2997 domain-containing protein [Planctomycetales bacterium]MCB9920903.1 DUF2997 domain-containing protein [Planctomycetaceae bacterium]
MKATTFKTIVITVSPQGETHLETKGFAGAECRRASQFLETALGAASQEQLTAEFHQATSATEAQLRQIS